MDNKVNYTFVGISVFLGFFCLFAFSYWLLKPSSKEELARYTIYFDESVLGLNIDAPVKYRGFAVGKVTELSLDPHNKEQVKVRIAIKSDTPIKTNTLAKLTAQGITGLSYINLIMSEEDAQPLVQSDTPPYPVIQSEPSFMETIERSLGDVSVNLSAALSRTAKLLDPQNKEQIDRILAKTASILDKVDSGLDQKTVQNFQKSMQNLEESSRKLSLLMPKVEHFIQNSVSFEDDLGASIASIKDTYLVVRSAMNRFEMTLKSGAFDIKEITSDAIPQLNKTLFELQQTLQKANALIEQYERSPGDILYKQEELRKGPGE